MTSKPEDEESAARWLADKEDAMMRALAPLVEINSFTENVEGGREVGHKLGELFALPGLEPRVVSSVRYADHLVFSNGGESPVALLGHLDTVFPPGSFVGCRREGDLAHGPGVLDMKGGLIVVAFALRAIAETAGSLPPVRVVVVADEEIGSPEGQGIIREHIAGARCVLVFEAGRAGDAIITRRKGTGSLEAAAHGKAAHAGNQHKEGKNAIWALARFVDLAQRLSDYGRGSTVNVGKIEGGQAKNSVPDFAQAWLDLRFTSRAEGEALLEALKGAAKQAAGEIDGTRLVLDGGIARLPLERTEASAALKEAYGACARASGLGDAEAPLIGGGSDASTAAAMGIPAIDGLGPRGTGFHTKEERIEVSSLVPKAQALARFLLRKEA